MTTIKISIITTFYNLEEYAKRCVDSLTSQTLQDIEIICVNDGSQDNTINILQELAQNDNRIKIIDKKNEGVSIARNTGINAASGEYIMFVDGDDYLEPNACEILYKKAIDTNVDIISFQRNFIIKDKITKDKSFYPNNNIKNKTYLFYDKIDETFQSIQILCWDKLYRKSLICKNNIKFPENLNFGEDSIFLFYCLETNPQILIIEDYLYNYTVSRKNSFAIKRKGVDFKIIGKEELSGVINKSEFLERYMAENNTSRAFSTKQSSEFWSAKRCRSELS